MTLHDFFIDQLGKDVDLKLLDAGFPDLTRAIMSFHGLTPKGTKFSVKFPYHDGTEVELGVHDDHVSILASTKGRATAGFNMQYIDLFKCVHWSRQ